MRIILCAGKGGVGKTSVSAATALKCASLGKKTLVMSLDPAHSLADAFDLDRRLHDHNRGLPISVGRNLWMQEVDVQEEVHRHWGEVHAYVSTLFNLSGLDEVLAEELAILPGMEEVSCLLYINQYYRQRTYDVIVLDCAPTGESLRFISVPTTLEWYMRKIFTLERALVRVARPIAKSFTSVPLPEDSYFQSLKRLFDKLVGVDNLLANTRVTSVRLVTNPEKMVLKETQRAFMYFCLYGLLVDAVIINRILPADVTDAYFGAWRRTQEENISRTEEVFAPVPVWRVRLFPDEVVGTPGLKALADDLYRRRDPMQFFYTEAPYRFAKRNGRYELTVRLPFVMKADVDVGAKGEELIIRIGAFKRHVPLPRTIAPLEPRVARVDGDRLVVTFGGRHAA